MIIAECNNDQALMHRLGLTPDQIRHEFGRSRALARVENWKKLLPVIGVVDEDPKAGRHPLMDNYEIVKTSGTINLMKRKDGTEKWLIIVPVFLEDWLCSVSKRNGIQPNDFGPPDDPVELHKMQFNKNENARRFLIEVVRTNDRELLDFKEWLHSATDY